MEKRLYIGNLAYSTHEEDLKEAFAEAGEVVSCTILLDRFTGKSRGFGFVEMATEEGAAKAIEVCDGKEMDGRNLRVNEARPREERGGGGGGGGGGGRRGGW